MHYKNGREAKEGDAVLFPMYGKMIAGNIFNLNAAATTCNGEVCYPVHGGTRSTSVNVNEGYLAQDAFDAVERATAETKPKAK